MNDELISNLKDGHDVSFFDLLRYIFSFNLPKSIDRPLNFPQPDWWILKVIIWLCMKSIKVIGWLFKYNFYVLKRIVSLIINNVKKIYNAKYLENRRENVLGLFYLYVISLCYYQIILPMQIILILVFINKFKPIVADILEKTYNFNYNELLILIKPIIQ